MKIRTGFVSNSSSASFIVTVGISKNSLCELLKDDLFWVLQRNLESIIEMTEKYGEDEELNELKALTPSDYNYVETILNKRYIYLEEDGHNTKIESDTTMFNDYGDVCNLMKNILTTLVFNGIMTKGEVKED
jgi:hypothetical protein